MRERELEGKAFSLGCRPRRPAQRCRIGHGQRDLTQQTANEARHLRAKAIEHYCYIIVQLSYNILRGGLCRTQDAALLAIRAFVFGTRNCAVPPAPHRMVRAFVRE
jgi:hypothetical protein